MAQSTAMYCGDCGCSGLTKILPGCMSAWKKLCRNTWAKKISTPRSASTRGSMPAARIASMSLTGMPWMRSDTITRRDDSARCTAGMYSSELNRKWRRMASLLLASRSRSSSARITV